MDTLTEEYNESVKGRIAQGYLMPGQSRMFFDYTELLKNNPHKSPERQAFFPPAGVPHPRQRFPSGVPPLLPYLFFQGFPAFSQIGLSQRASDFSPECIADFAARSTPSFQQRADLFCEELQFLKKNDYALSRFRYIPPSTCPYAPVCVPARRSKAVYPPAGRKTMKLILYEAWTRRASVP